MQERSRAQGQPGLRRENLFQKPKRQAMVIQTWVFGRHFLENELYMFISSKKTTVDGICVQ
jgi:hypothetical protein